jgi:hypothetical protein
MVEIYTYAWQPYGQPAGGSQKVNDTDYLTSDGINMGDRVMFDSLNWKQIAHAFNTSVRDQTAILKIPGAAAWFYPFVVNRNSMIYGAYKGDDPIFKANAGKNGWDPRPINYGSISQTNDPNFKISNDGTTINGLLAGINHLAASTQSDNICDILYHKGTIYVAGQHYLMGMNIGTKGTWIFHDNANDNNVNDINDTSTYTARASQQVYGGSLSRSLTIHNDKVYMLSNNGKVHEVMTGGLKQLVDLSQLGTPWASGIADGSLSKLSGSWAGNASFRCFLASFNKQLHAFLNFDTNFNVAKPVDGTTGKGIFWGTSFDGENWTDNSVNLPASGIISPSGTGAAAVNWLAHITPYRFSGFVGSGALPQPDIGLTSAHSRTAIGSLNAGEDMNPTRPSGFRQTGLLSYWSSGVLVDTEGTTFNNLQVPLQFGEIGRYLFPTLINYPEAVVPSGSLFVPSGTGPTGYDYSSCGNYHISGFSDDQDNRLKIIFSRDFDEKENLLFELTTSSGWIRRNYLTNVNQLNGLIPVMLYDPEIIIASGTLANPNPRINEVNQTVEIDYTVYDWPFWGTVNVIGEYSLNGINWNPIKTVRNVSTGSQISDPSGVIGTQNTFTWNYTQDGIHANRLNKNIFYPCIQVRLRAEEA